ncbi:hypothetical protein KUV65_17555 [Maritalea mobilis]|uniref:hypothetical protein n=1 Tax=Maritalea mobilis TaxID=483324 RepID=UPI001C953F1B|nr:hypothetical protein [Maritalea mobilis]MBY6203179.1 hypothetical protein [Maritalea mobilis]
MHSAIDDLKHIDHPTTHFIAQELIDQSATDEVNTNIPSAETLQAFATTLAEYKSALEQANSNIQQQFDIGKKRGRPTNNEARTIAWSCGAAFRDLAGRAPSVTTDPITYEASGPFLDFVAVAFDTFDVNGSVETWARQAVKDVKEEKFPAQWN